MSQPQPFNYDPASYPDQEGLDTALAQIAIERAIAERTYLDANDAYVNARNSGLDPVSGKPINQSELTNMQAKAVAAKRQFEQMKQFETDAPKARGNLKPRATVKSEADLKAAKDIARADFKSGGIGNVPGAKKTPETKVVQRAREYTEMAPEDQGGLVNTILGRFVPKSLLGTVLQAINPVAAVTSTAEGMASRQLAGDINSGEAVLPEDAPTKINQAGITGNAQGQIGSKRQIEADPNAYSDPYTTVQPATLTPEDRAKKGVASLNQDVFGSQNQATAEINKAGGKAHLAAYGMKGTQLASLAGTVYSLLPSKTPKLGTIIADTDKLEGKKWKAMQEKLEPLRANEVSNSADFKALGELRESIRSDAIKAFRDRVKVNVDGMDPEDLFKQVSAQGLAGERNRAWVKANEAAIEDWATKPRSHSTRASINAALDEYTKDDPKAAIVYLGKDRYGVKSKKLEGGSGGWTVAQMKDGKLSVAQDESDWDKKPVEGMTLGEYKKLKGGQSAYDSYKRSKEGTPEADEF